MRIAIDLDDTISCTKEEINYNLNIYIKENNIKEEEINRSIIKEFLDIYAYECLENAKIKEDASKYINLLQKDNEIYIITARSNSYVKCITDAEKLSLNWLKKNNIIPDKIIINSYGKEKAIECIKNNIDIIIDDDINNIEEFKKDHIKYLIFDDHNKTNDKNKVTNWKEIYDIIQNM